MGQFSRNSMRVVKCVMLKAREAQTVQYPTFGGGNPCETSGHRTGVRQKNVYYT